MVPVAERTIQRVCVRLAQPVLHPRLQWKHIRETHVPVTISVHCAPCEASNNLLFAGHHCCLQHPLALTRQHMCHNDPHRVIPGTPLTHIRTVKAWHLHDFMEETASSSVWVNTCLVAR